MNNEILFSESQRFRQWWLWLIILGVNALTLVECFNAFFEHAGAPPNYLSLLVSFAFLQLCNLLLFMIRLDTMIKPDGIYARFFPFSRRFKQFSWDTISGLKLRQYEPLTEYGGWGLRFSRCNGKAYTISGNKGIQLVFNDGSKLLIGTNRYEEVKEILEKLEVKSSIPSM